MRFEPLFIQIKYLISCYEDVLAFFKRKAKECPQGVTLKLANKKNVQLQFVFPDTGKRSAKPCNVQFTEEGGNHGRSQISQGIRIIKKIQYQ